MASDCLIHRDLDNHSDSFIVGLIDSEWIFLYVHSEAGSFCMNSFRAALCGGAQGRLFYLSIGDRVKGFGNIPRNLSLSTICDKLCLLVLKEY